MREYKKLAPRQIALWTSFLILFGWGLSGCGLGSTSAAMRGQQLFQNCVPCHQVDGSGNPQVGAPNIAGMKAWYVQAQLQKFRAGTRGMHFSDVEGMRMRPMALSLITDGDVTAVSAYVETLPPVKHAPTLTGDAHAGDNQFHLVCASCHGTNGEGNADVKAPRLAGVDDWYLATQLRKFKAGIRGNNSKDIEGRLMRPMARILTDEDAIRNVMAYLDTLKP
ncbi:MAG: c-type cytochrome [Acidobacteriia bacterium]|nr:c-type cytochrome [Terriglobia bacterium]